jgi:hypothetical protein
VLRVPFYVRRYEHRNRRTKNETGSPAAEPMGRVPGDLRYAPRRKKMATYVSLVNFTEKGLDVKRQFLVLSVEF